MARRGNRSVLGSSPSLHVSRKGSGPGGKWARGFEQSSSLASREGSPSGEEIERVVSVACWIPGEYLVGHDSKLSREMSIQVKSDRRHVFPRSVWTMVRCI